MDNILRPIVNKPCAIRLRILISRLLTASIAERTPVAFSPKPAPVIPCPENPLIPDNDSASLLTWLINHNAD